MGNDGKMDIAEFEKRFNTKAEHYPTFGGYMNRQHTVGYLENLLPGLELGEKTVVENPKRVRANLRKTKPKNVKINGCVFNADLVKRALFLVDDKKPVEFFKGVPKDRIRGWTEYQEKQRNFLTIIPAKNYFLFIAPRIVEDEETYKNITDIREFEI